MRLAITKVDQCLEQWNAHTLLMAVQTWSWKPAVSTKANHVPTRLGLRVAGLGTELDKNKRRTRDLASEAFQLRILYSKCLGFSLDF